MEPLIIFSLGLLIGLFIPRCRGPVGYPGPMGMTGEDGRDGKDGKCCCDDE